jgi:cell division protein ZapD
VLLGMLRDSGAPHKVAATAGQFQQSLPAGRVYQLMRVRVDGDVAPEITGHRLMVSIRMMRPDAEGKLRSSAADIPFELSLCA